MHLEGGLLKFGYLDQDEIKRFARTYFKGPLDTADKPPFGGFLTSAFRSDQTAGHNDWKTEGGHVEGGNIRVRRRCTKGRHNLAS